MSLRKSLSAWGALKVISGGFLPSLFVSVWALSEIGLWSLLVWGAVAGVGIIQAGLLLALSQHYPNQSGGTATYAHCVWSGRWRVLAFLSSWCYWLAWAPATAFNCFLCAQLLTEMMGWALSPISLALVLMGLIYTLHYLGWARILLSSTVLMVLVGVPLAVLGVITVQTSSLNTLQTAWTPFPGWLNLLKWFFVIAWTGYGVEMVSSVVAEMRSRQFGLLYGMASLISIGAFVAIPLMVALLTDGRVNSDNLWASLAPTLEAKLGTVGTVLLGILIVSALLYSALAILVPSTRTVYQMARDGLLPEWFGTVNRFGMPYGSFTADLALNVGLLLIFGESLASLLACANIGYMVVFVLLPLVYWSAVIQGMPLSTQSAHKGLSIVLLGLNAVVLLLGGAMWGHFVFGLGWGLVLLGLLIHQISQKSRIFR